MPRGRKTKLEPLAPVPAKAPKVTPIPDVVQPSIAAALQRVEYAIKELTEVARTFTLSNGSKVTVASPGRDSIRPVTYEEVEPVKEPVAPDVATATIAAAGKHGAAKVKAVLARFNARKAGDVGLADIPRYLTALYDIQ